MSDDSDLTRGARHGAVKALCRTLKLPTVVREFVQAERVALSEACAPGEHLHTLLDAEVATRVEHAVARRLRAARLPASMTRVRSV